MSMAYIRKIYKVPAKRGGRVDVVSPRDGSVIITGTITGADGAYLRVRLPGSKRSHRYHPTDNVRYHEADAGKKAEGDMKYWIVKRYVVEIFSIKARGREDAINRLGEGWYMTEQRTLKETAKADKRRIDF